MGKYVWELWEVERHGLPDLCAATVESNTLAEGRREIMHYAMMYGQDGPVEIRRIKPPIAE